jgi:predicted dehydrogenase
MKKQSAVRTAVVGCGYWGKNLVRNFAALSDLRICCDADDGVRARIAGEYPQVKTTADYSSVLTSDEVEAVVLATPASAHAEMALAALDAGKHVFVEKPLALCGADAEHVVEAAERTRLILMVGHLMEYHPAIDHLKGMVESGELGDVYYSYSQRVNLGKVRSDENALWSLAPHDISMILYLMGEEPEHVEATGQAFLQAGIEDVVFVTMRFASGRVAHVHVSWLDPHKERRITIVGSKKMVVFDDVEASEKVRVYDKGVARQPTTAPAYASYGELLALREGDIVIPRLPSKEPLSIECGEFLKAIETGVPPRSDGRDGLAVVRVLEAAQHALDARKTSFAGVTP